MGFLEEYEDAKWSKTLTLLVVGLIIAVTIFLSVVSSDIPSGIVIYLMACAFVILLAALTEKETKDELLNGNFFGVSKGNAYLALVGGLTIATIIGIATRGGTLNISLPTQGIYLGDLRPLFANIFAPILESLFWRGVIYPTVLAFLLTKLKAKIPCILLALAIAGFGFGISHVAVFNTQNILSTFDLIKTAALFGIIFTLVTYLAKTITAEWGWHFGNNLFSEGYPVPTIIASMAAFAVVFVVMTEFSDKKGK